MGWFRRTPSEQDGLATSYEERLAQIGPGVPGHCPACDGLGYIDSIDIGHRYQIQHCKDCLHRWEYLFDADGNVVGLTELDSDGRPVARSRVRTTTDVPVVPPAPAPPPEPAPVLEAGAADDALVDLRDEAEPGPPVLDLRGSEPTALSPAEWLRQAARR